MRRELIVAFAALLLGAETAPVPRSLTLEELLQRMKTTRGVVAEFREEKHLALLEEPLVTRGTLYFAPPDRLARLTREPAQTRLVLDGRRMRFEDANGANDVDLGENPVARHFAENLTALWSGNRSALEALYRLEFTSEGARWQLRLVPKGDPLARFIASIALSGEGDRMQAMQLLEVDGDRTETVFARSEVDHAFAAEEASAVFGTRP